MLPHLGGNSQQIYRRNTKYMDWVRSEALFWILLIIISTCWFPISIFIFPTNLSRRSLLPAATIPACCACSAPAGNGLIAAFVNSQSYCYPATCWFSTTPAFSLPGYMAVAKGLGLNPSALAIRGLVIFFVAGLKFC